MKKIVKLLIFILVFPLILEGCYNYREINLVTFVTSIIFDVDDFGNVIVYMDCIKPYRNESNGSDNGKRSIYKGKGKSSLEAIRNINMSSSYKINFTQNRACIFTEKAAKSGIEKFLSIIENDQEFQMKPYVFVYFGDTEELLNVSKNDEEYLGLFLSELVQKNKANSRIISVNINEYLTESQKSSNYSLIGALHLKDDLGEKRVELDGGVLMKENQMKEKIDVNDVLSYNFLKDNLSTGILEVENPQEKDKFITLEILDNKTKTKIEYDGMRILLKKKINTKVSISEIQGRFIYSDEALKNLQKREEKEIEMHLRNFFNKFNKKHVDILGVNRYLEMKYPKEKIENILSIIDLDLDINLNIEGSNRIKNSLL